MSKLDELYRLHRLLDGRRSGISRATLIGDHGFKGSSLSRHVADLRDKLGAPLIHDRDRGGYRYDTTDGRHHLPGLWLTGQELAALMSLHTLLQEMQPGLLDDLLAPIRERVRGILATEHLGSGEAAKRIRLLSSAARGQGARHFQAVAEAVLQRKQLAIEYYNRERDEVSERIVCPQRLARYRDNWYLDAWCHQRKALRIFAVDAMRGVTVLNRAARSIPDARLDKELGSAYGIFAGKPRAIAVLVFTPARARWVSEEAWHPKQRSRWLADGRFELRVPFSDNRELLMDILKFGPDVEVAAPEELRLAVKARLGETVGLYQ